MGLFGNKQQDQPVYQDEPPLQDAPAPAQSTDGFFPAPAHPDPSGTSAPVLDEHTHDDEIGGYIMAEPPVTSQPAPEEQLAEAPAAAPAEEPAFEAEPEQEAPSQESTGGPETGMRPIHEASPTPSAEDTADDILASPAAADSQGDTLDELADIKRQALQQLSPLVNHLDQSPEERFRTTLMLLQSTDDKTLIKPAYESAQAITDDKARAQALLEIIKEVDYFTNK